jgi:very-short-patch-repair endonuclease
MSVIPFERSFASNYERSPYWSSINGTITPRDVYKSSNKKYWFNCSKCKHLFEKSLDKITSGEWCPYCGNKQLCDNNECDYCFEKSFASHERAQYWNSENTEIPRNIFKSSHTKYWFDCSECKHSFISALDIITRGSWCSYCSNKQLCNDECKYCFEKSFASHERSKCWSSINGTIIPRNVFKSSNIKYWFNCSECKHSFNSVLHSITSEHWCPFCGNKKLCKDDCKNCFEKSFASHQRSQYWSIKNKENPRNIFKSSHTKYWFDCSECKHLFNSPLNNIISGTWCPNCKHKTEIKLFTKLKDKYLSLQQQFKQEWCKKIRYLPFDFCIEELKIIIELDGLQHFQQVSNWLAPEEQFENDKYKEKCANENGYSVVRILQEDVFKDTYDWYTKLCDTIEEIKNNGKVVNVYLCNNGEYNCYN